MIVRDERWRVLDLAPAVDCAELRLAAAGETNRGRTRTFLLPFDRVRRVDRRTRPRPVGRARWVRGLSRILAERLPPGGLLSPASAAIDLLPYQLEPALAFVRGCATRVLLADDVGLGKTVQAGLVLHELRARGEGRRALVLVPAGLKAQWVDELRSRFGLAAVVADAWWLKDAALRLPREVNPWSLPGVFVTSIDFVKRPEAMAGLEEVAWDLVIVDEAHGATGATDRRVAADALCRRARYVVLATATPHPGDPAAFETLCTTGRLDPDEPPVLLFQRSAADVSELAGRKRRRTRLLLVSPTPEERRMHRLLETYTQLVWRAAAGRDDRDPLVAMIVLRKRALSGALALLRSLLRRRAALAGEPPPVQLALPFDAGEEDAADPGDEEPSAVLAGRGLADAAQERALLDELVEAARAAERAESKPAFLRRALRRAAEPAIVFTEYRDTLLHLAELLAPGARVALVHGGMPAPSRRDELARFTAGEARLLLATDAAGEGLNLQARCRWVIHCELPWSPLRLEQRTGRVDRLGQRRRVHAWHLAAADTAEQLVLARLAARLEAIRAATGRRYELGAAAEKAIAEAIVTGAAVPDLPAVDRLPASVSWRLPPPELAEAARSEAVRHALARAIPPRPPAPRRPRMRGIPAGPWIARARLRGWRGPGRVLAIVRQTARDGLGRPVLSDPWLVALPRPPAGAAERHAIQHVLHARLSARLDEARALHAAAVRLATAREETMTARWRSGVAADLVQLGLFDRRAIREAERRRTLDRRRLDEARARLAALRTALDLVVDPLEVVLVLVRR